MENARAALPPGPAQYITLYRLLPASRTSVHSDAIFSLTERLNQILRSQEEVRMPRSSRINLLALFASMLLVSACGTTTPLPDNSIIKTVHDIGEAAPFSNILVVSVAGDHPSRARFEQEVAEIISSETTIATPFYAVVGRNPQVTRDILNNVVRARVFDAIVLTRLQGQDRAELVANRPTGRQFDFYLYDYAELNFPVSIKVGSTVSFVVEFYDTRAEKKVWAIDSLIFNSQSVATAVAQQATTIAAEILKDGLVR